MSRVAVTRLLTAFALVAALAAATGAGRAAAPAADPCVQVAQPAWIDYGDKWVPFRRYFFRDGLAVALAHDAPGDDARRNGAQVAFWAMSLKRAVGTPARPADPASIPAATARLLKTALRVTGCSTPVIALNELFGAHRPAPWTPKTSQYRANVLALVRGLAQFGAQPHLLISQAGATGGASANWWRAVAQSATIAREVYIPAPWLHSLGPGRASVFFRFELRRAIRNFTTIGIPSSRLAVALGFQQGVGGRMGLARVPWLGLVKRETLAARQVVRELGVGTVWTWGWATFPGRRFVPASRQAACVYLWARNPSLCDGPATAGRGFDRSLRQPAEGARRVTFRLLSSRHPAWFRLNSSPKLAARVAFVQVRRTGPWRSVQRLLLGPLRARPVRVPLADGRWLVRLWVAPENAPNGGSLWTPPVALRVH